MADKRDLIGLGMMPFMARRLAAGSIQVTGVGGSRASAAVLPGDAYVAAVVATNTGNGVMLPPVGGDTGCLLGDQFDIINMSGSQLTVYANSQLTGLGSAVALAGGATNVSLFTVTNFAVATLQVLTASQWSFGVV